MVFVATRFGSYEANPQKTVAYFSQQYNLPEGLPWEFNWGSCVLFALTAGAAVFVLHRKRRAEWWRAVAAAVAAALCASVVWSQAPSAVMAPYMRMNLDQADFIMNIALCAAAGMGLVLAVFVFPGRSAVWKVAPLALVCVFYAASPKWRTGGAELLAKGTRLHEQAAAELAPLLPEGAIVIGERANNVFMSTPVKSAATALALTGNPIPVIRKILEEEPGTPMFALIDPHHSYAIKHFDDNKDWVRIVPVKQVQLPSFGGGTPVPVTLCRVMIIRN